MDLIGRWKRGARAPRRGVSGGCPLRLIGSTRGAAIARRASPTLDHPRRRSRETSTSSRYSRHERRWSRCSSRGYLLDPAVRHSRELGIKRLIFADPFRHEGGCLPRRARDGSHDRLLGAASSMLRRSRSPTYCYRSCRSMSYGERHDRRGRSTRRSRARTRRIGARTRSGCIGAVERLGLRAHRRSEPRASWSKRSIVGSISRHRSAISSDGASTSSERRSGPAGRAADGAPPCQGGRTDALVRGGRRSRTECGARERELRR